MPIRKHSMAKRLDEIASSKMIKVPQSISSFQGLHKVTLQANDNSGSTNDCSKCRKLEKKIHQHTQHHTKDSKKSANSLSPDVLMISHNKLPGVNSYIKEENSVSLEDSLNSSVKASSPVHPNFITNNNFNQDHIVGGSHVDNGEEDDKVHDEDLDIFVTNGKIKQRISRINKKLSVTLDQESPMEMDDIHEFLC